MVFIEIISDSKFYIDLLRGIHLLWRWLFLVFFFSFCFEACYHKIQMKMIVLKKQIIAFMKPFSNIRIKYFGQRQAEMN